MAPEDNPADDVQPTKEEYEKCTGETPEVIYGVSPVYSLYTKYKQDRESIAKAAAEIRKHAQIHQEAEDKFKTALENYLRMYGWVYNSCHPGALWMWEKTINGIRYAVEAKTAFEIQTNITPQDFPDEPEATLKVFKN